jgi:type I restriction enzyme, S subunit
MSFPQYKHYKESGVEWLGEVPEGWMVKPVKAVSTCNDEVLDVSTSADFEIEYVEISGVDADHGIMEATTVPFGTSPSRARRRVKDGDVIVSTVRTYLRAIAQVIKPQENMIVSTGFAVIRPRSIHSNFLGYLFRSEFLISEVIARSVGVSYPAINASELMCLKAPIPSRPEQQTIAAFLDRETSKIDELVTEQERLIALLREKRKAVISHAVTKGLNPDVSMNDSGIEWLGEVPKHWEVTRLANIFHEAIEKGAQDLPFLSVSIHHGVSDRELDEEERDRKVIRSEDPESNKRVRHGDLVYNMMRAWQGGFGAVKTNGMVSPAYVVARPRVDLNTSYIELLLRTPQAIEEMRRYSRGVTDFRLRLYWDSFKDIFIALPPKAEMDQILTKITALNENFVTLITESESMIGLLKERRRALISAAVTGKIDVRRAD